MYGSYHIKLLLYWWSEVKQRACPTKMRCKSRKPMYAGRRKTFAFGPIKLEVEGCRWHALASRPRHTVDYRERSGVQVTVLWSRFQDLIVTAIDDSWHSSVYHRPHQCFTNFANVTLLGKWLNPRFKALPSSVPHFLPNPLTQNKAHPLFLQFHCYVFVESSNQSHSSNPNVKYNRLQLQPYRRKWVIL